MPAAPPIPGEPDLERRTRYTSVSTAGPFNVAFDIYGDGSDFWDWVQVWVNGVQIDYSGNWALSSPSGSLAALPRPITDAQITFNLAQTGTLDIVGARRPRRLVQYTENKGVPARDQNQVLTDIIMTERERWDRESRLVMANPGETMAPLPPAASRANQSAIFDAGGNLTPGSPPAGGVTISAAMQPVVSAATTALARTAMGTGGVGLGLLLDSNGNFQVNGGVDTDSTNQAVTSSFHMSERHATAVITYTYPASSTLFAGFGHFIYSLGGRVTLAIDPGDQFYNGVAGTSLIVPQGQGVFVSTDGAGNWFIRGMPTPTGMGTATNLQINATVSGNALTVALKDRNGNDATDLSPILVATRDATLTNGDPVTLAVVSALSIVIPSSATLGTTNGKPNRLWVVLFNNALTPVLGVINCSTASEIFPLVEAALQSPTQISSGATSAGVFYSSAAGLSGVAFRILGYVESTQATAGTWATSPSVIQLFGPGIKKPGDIVQTVVNPTTTVGSTTSNSFVALTNGQSASITPTSAVNLIRVFAQGTISNNGAGAGAGIEIVRGVSTVIGNPLLFTAAISAPAALLAYDAPGSVSSQTYAIWGKAPSAATISYPPASSGAILELQEIMG